ncbi:MAG: FKBP-type peptidyl-prolyl cis-trans isomerase [Nitriliruptorales bacterium]
MLSLDSGFGSRLTFTLAIFSAILALASCSTSQTENGPLLSLPRANEANEPPLPNMQGPPPDDLVVRDMRPGSGELIETNRLIVVNFVVSEWGSVDVLDSTSRRGIARIWPYGSGKLIPGVEEGLEGMREGGRRVIIVPPRLGYGDEALPGTTGELPLIFVIDLIEIAPRASDQS